VQDEYQATVLEELFVQLEVTGWQRNAALEPPVGDLQAVDRGAMESWRQRALTSHQQASFVQDDFHLSRIDAGQSDQKSEFITVLEQIDRWLPGGYGVQGFQRKKTPLQLLRTLEKVERLSPHPEAPVTRSH
jgi:hypothetical protein